MPTRHTTYRRRRSRALTLVELIVVLVILAVVAAIVWISSGAVVASSEQRSAEQTAASVGAAAASDARTERRTPRDADVLQAAARHTGEVVFGAPGGGGRAVVGDSGCADVAPQDDGSAAVIGECRDLVAIGHDAQDTEHGTDAHLTIVDLTDLDNPAQLGSTAVTPSIFDVNSGALLDGGETLLLGAQGLDGGNQQILATLDVSDPSDPELLDVSINTSAEAAPRLAVTSDGRTAVVSGWSNDAVAYDIADRQSIAVGATTDFRSSDTPVAAGSVVVGEPASGELAVLDARDAEVMAELGRVSATGDLLRGLGASPDEGTVYVRAVDWQAGSTSVVGVSVDDPADPSITFDEALEDHSDFFSGGLPHIAWNPHAQRLLLAEGADGSTDMTLLELSRDGVVDAWNGSVPADLGGGFEDQHVDFAGNRAYFTDGSYDMLHIVEFRGGDVDYVGTYDGLDDMYTVIGLPHDLAP